MLKKIVIIMLAVSLMCLTACGKKESDPEGMTQIPNPLKSFDSLEEAVKDSGIKAKFPASIKGNKMDSFVTINSVGILEVGYGPDIYVRVAKTGDDISGDYNEYKWTATAEKDGYQFTAYGTSESSFSKVTGKKDGYVYSINSGKGLSIAEIKSIVDEIIFE